MQKKKIIIFALLLLSFSIAIYQYIEEFKTDFASAAYSVTKPANGHSWDEMMCTKGLCVAGDNVQMDGTLKITTGAGAGKVLTSDADGMATWGAASGGAGTGTTNYISKWSNGTTLGNSTVFDNGTNVGIGTVSPSKKLEVSGDMLATGDICNGGGKCLSSIFQTNVIVGTNPTCPAGQSAIMKANSGIWYTASASQVASSWNQVTCGMTLSGDGTALLYGSAHTAKACTDAGGTVVSDGSGNNFCRFNATSCGTWTQYQNWSSTVGNYWCQGSTSWAACGCLVGYHDWSNNNAIESCQWLYSDWRQNNACTSDQTGTCSATRTQIGCY